MNNSSEFSIVNQSHIQQLEEGEIDSDAEALETIE